MNAQVSLSMQTADTVKAGQKNTPTQAPVAVRQKPDVPTPKPAPDLKQILQSTSKFFQERNMSLYFSVDEASGRSVVTVIDADTSEVIRQFPSDEMLNVSRRLAQVIEENSVANSAVLFEKSA